MERFATISSLQQVKGVGMNHNGPRLPAQSEATDRPTLKTVAEITGLAVTTVSRALANDPKIAEATRARVSEAAKLIGYAPNHAARRLRTGKTMVINLLLDPHFEVLGFGNALLVGATMALEGSGYNLVVTPHFNDVDPLVPIQNIVTNRLADGILFSRTGPFDARVRFLLEQKFPFVSHGRTEFTEPHSWVDYDNEEFAYRATLRLVEKGCHNVCVLLPPESLTFCQHLRYGVMRAVRETGVGYHIPTTVTLDSSMQEINEWAGALATSEGRPDGFICPGEASFLAVRNAFRSHGLRAGRDYQAVVKSISGILSQIDPDIDTIYEDVEEAGRMMASQLLAMLSDDTLPRPSNLQKPTTSFRE